MQDKLIVDNNIQIWFETFGSRDNPPVLLMMGNSCDAIMWPVEFCQSLADRGYFVIRFDQRDTGLSTWLDFSTTPYTLLDMVKDSISLLDSLHIPKANIVGFSTGGLIAQLMAIHFPNKVQSLVLMMSSIDLTIKNDAFMGLDMANAKLPPPKKEFIEDIIRINSVKPTTFQETVKQLVDNFRSANGYAAPYDEQYFYQLFETSLTRVNGKSKKGGHESNHALATSATPVIKEEEFAQIKVPTLVIAGAEDPIFPPAHAEATAKAIPDAQLMLVEKMGHTLNPVFFDLILDKMNKFFCQ